MELTQQNESQGKPPHEKQYTIFVNSRQKVVIGKESLTFDDIVALAFDSPAKGPNIIYTVTFSRAHGHKPEGTLVEGESVRLKDGMVFDVTRTDRS